METTKVIEFERPQMDVGLSCTANAWARIPEAPDAEEKLALKARVRQLLKEKQAVLVAHYYVDAELQDLAEETGGCVSDSLEMARFGRDHPAKILVVAGVKFMGETAKILSPEKTILMQIWTPPVPLIWVVLQMNLQRFAMRIRIVRWWFMPIPVQQLRHERTGWSPQALVWISLLTYTRKVKNLVGTGQTSGQLYPEANWCRYVAVARLLSGA